MGGKCTFARIIALLSVVFIILSAGCVGSGNDDLVFVERESSPLDSSQDNTPTPETRTSNLDLTVPSRKMTLCVLPFRNLSHVEGLDNLVEMFHTMIMYKLEDFDRLFSAELIDQQSYNDLIKSLGMPKNSSPNSLVADKVRLQHHADIILFGDINVVENVVVIEPYVISFEGGYKQEKLDPMPVNLNNFIGLVNPLVDELINEIIQQQNS